jgi:HEAT repeat protein
MSALDSVLPRLHSSDPAEVTRAVHAVRELLPGLPEPDFRRAAAALCGLFYVDSYDRPDLDEALEQAEEALAAAGEPAIPVLIRLMEGSDIKCHLHLAKVLGRIGAASVPHLRRIVATAEDPYARSFALFALGKIRAPSVQDALPEAIGALMHPDKEVRDSAARTLGKIVEAIPPSALTERRRGEVQEALVRAVGDAQPAVRAKAVRSLGKMAANGYLSAEQSSRVQAVLDALVTRSEESDWDRAYIVRREVQEARMRLKTPWLGS